MNLDSSFSQCQFRCTDPRHSGRAEGMLGTFTTSDMATIAYEETGSGRPLLFLHGLMAHGGFFRRQDELANAFRLIRIDLRGHGGSRNTAPADPTGRDFDRMAADVAELVEQLDLRDAIGIGWSLGAAILWQLLSGRARDRFAGAVVVDMTPRVLNGDDWTLGLTREHCEARSAAMRDGFHQFALAAGQAIFAEPVEDGKAQLAQWAGDQFARNDPAVIASTWNALVHQDFRPLLSLIQQPTLIIHGAHSQLYSPATAHYLAATLPNASEMEFEGSGHAPQLEEPERFNAAIRHFAAGLPAARQQDSRTDITGERE